MPKAPRDLLALRDPEEKMDCQVLMERMDSLGPQGEVDLMGRKEHQ